MKYNPVEEFDEMIKEEQPKYDTGDLEWTSYVLSLLTDHELKNGNPTVDGLRRVCEKVYGEILESRIEILKYPDPTKYKDESCIAQCQLKIQKKNGVIITVESAVDVRYENTESPYREFLVATADSRAEAKALRRALKLNVVTAEEVSEEDSQKIGDHQIIAIDKICQRTDINVRKFLKKYLVDGQDIQTLSKSICRTVFEDLSLLQNNTTKIPKSIKGYDKDWNK